jgi:hypothetical protein
MDGQTGIKPLVPSGYTGRGLKRIFIATIDQVTPSPSKMHVISELYLYV